MSRRFSISPATYYVIALIALVFMVAIVVTGGAVRLTNSGLGCPDWPTCESGSLVGTSDSHAAIESINRLVTGVVAIGVIVVALASRLRRPYRPDMFHLALGLIAGVLAQIVIGGIVVLSHVQYTTVSIHFLVSQAIVAIAVVLVVKAGEYRRPAADGGEPNVPTRRLARAVGVWSIVVIVLGTIVTSSGPHPGDPDAERLPLDLLGVTRVHSIAAVLLLGLVVAFIVYAHRVAAPIAARRSAWALAVLIVAQALIGYSQWLTRLPAFLVGVHILGATLVWIAVVRLNLAMSEARARESRGSIADESADEHARLASA